MSRPAIVQAIGKLLKAGVALVDHFYILNQWR